MKTTDFLPESSSPPDKTGSWRWPKAIFSTFAFVAYAFGLFTYFGPVVCAVASLFTVAVLILSRAAFRFVAEQPRLAEVIGEGLRIGLVIVSAFFVLGVVLWIPIFYFLAAFAAEKYAHMAPLATTVIVLLLLGSIGGGVWKLVKKAVDVMANKNDMQGKFRRFTENAEKRIEKWLKSLLSSVIKEAVEDAIRNVRGRGDTRK